jgi:hypothetical protein
VRLPDAPRGQRGSTGAGGIGRPVRIELGLLVRHDARAIGA